VKILLIRFSSIGDIVLTSPVVRCLAQQLSGVEIHYLTKETFRPLVAHNPHVHHVHTISEAVGEVIPALRAEAFDYVADLHRNLRSGAVVRGILPKKVATLNKLNIRKWVLANLRVDTMPEESIVERYLDTVKPLGVRNDGAGLDFFIPDAARTADDDLPFGHSAGFVACVIGGSYATKQLPVEQWRALVEAIPFPVVLLGGQEDRADGEAIGEGFGLKVYNACGKFSLLESADLVRRAQVVVTNDTGLMHVAAAFRKPIVSFWGSSAPGFGMFPYFGFNTLRNRPASQSVMMEVRGLRCHPCSKLGYGKCPRGHFKCMRNQDIGAAAAAVKNFWRVSPNASRS